ncbi:ABC transporter substrate-binding protein [Mycobacterium kyorinense]|uniref:Iron ABC transporter substrate-binding protein n=1 Tax=Mycobacterium kyorinense TaxID=487514 RepID=A0A1X1XFF4_9MYCO|nr:iron ABC transporter substrate-binding protein [Mycobacterium kyorinense]
MKTHDRWGRRQFLGFAGTSTLLAAGWPMACSSKKPTTGRNAEGGAPVTVPHVFGETTIPEPPRRVVSAGYTGQDDLLAVGVVPIAVTQWFGDQPFAVWPWAQPKLGDAKPVVLNLDNGIPVDQIAKLKPDLIVATNAGVDADTYQKLAAVAPTIAQSDGEAFFEPWKEQATAIGHAVYQADQMKSLVDGVDQKFAAVAQQNPQFKGKKVLLLQGRLSQDNAVATAGWRTEFLTQMGLVVSDSITPFAVDSQRALIPRDKLQGVLAAADVLIWTTDGEEDQQALLAVPEVAARQSHSVFTTKDQTGAIAFASPLSYPVVADQLPPLITKALGV